MLFSWLLVGARAMCQKGLVDLLCVSESGRHSHSALAAFSPAAPSRHRPERLKNYSHCVLGAFVWSDKTFYQKHQLFTLGSSQASTWPHCRARKARERSSGVKSVEMRSAVLFHLKGSAVFSILQQGSILGRLMPLCKRSVEILIIFVCFTDMPNCFPV